jgi:hypothetical protein
LYGKTFFTFLMPLVLNGQIPALLGKKYKALYRNVFSGFYSGVPDDGHVTGRNL